MLNPASTVAAAVSAATGTMLQGQTHITLYLSDPQLEHLGPRSCVDNPIVDAVIKSADRNLVSTATTPLYIDSLLHTVRGKLQTRELPASTIQKDTAPDPTLMSLQVLGDVPDTPCKDEMTHMERVLDRHDIPVDGYDRGNHSSSNAYGVVNLGSRLYRFLKRVFFRKDVFKDDVCQSCGGEDNLLTPKATFEGMHRILHRHHPNPLPIEKVSTSVGRADGKSYRLRPSQTNVPFTPENSARTFETFWRPTVGIDRKTRYWEAMVNFEVADLPVGQRPTKVNPFYVQAVEEARFHLDDGTQVPVYAVSMDSLDNTSPIAVIPGVSALQVRLIENFIAEKLKENPNARFKLSSHFAATTILKGATSCEARDLFRKLLSRDEVVLVSGGHTHNREIKELNEHLKLGRKTLLWEFIVPSLIDFDPTHNLKSQLDEDGRALVIETMTVDKDANGQPVLKIDLEYQGLDREDLTYDFMPKVEEKLTQFKRDHGYLRAKETIGDLKRTHIKGFLKRRLRQLGQFFTDGLVPFRWTAFRKFWSRALSPAQALVDNLTVVSAVQMFNEVKHFIPFLDGVLHFLEEDAEPGEAAARAQIQGIRNLLQSEYDQRRPQFEAAVARGESAADLKSYADLYRRAGLEALPELLLDLKVGGRARAFAALAGIDASQAEYEYERSKPTNVPNKVPVISVRLAV